METRVALLSIIVSDTGQTAKLNEYLHEAGPYIIGRMGVPYRQRNVSIISVVVDAPQKDISAMTGKLGMIAGVNVKTVYSKA
jgi:putative iron-only hydrogenase system regulator